MKEYLLESLVDLEALKGQFEGDALEFKETIDVQRAGLQLELAKDCAAFANALGGWIVVGASTERTTRTRCTGFHGVEGELADRIRAEFEKAAEHRCAPRPELAFTRIELAVHGPVVLVVHVRAVRLGPVGVSVRISHSESLILPKERRELVDRSWSFPVRSNAATAFLEPDDLAAYASMNSRHIAVVLSRIPSNERQRVFVRWTIDNITGAHAVTFGRHEFTLVGFDLDSNTVDFVERDDVKKRTRIPLDEIATVWREDSGWVIAIRGLLRSDSNRLEYFMRT